LLNEFLNKGWKLGSIDYLLKKIRKTGTGSRQPGSFRPRSARTDENIETVDVLNTVRSKEVTRVPCSLVIDVDVVAVVPLVLECASVVRSPAKKQE